MLSSFWISGVNIFMFSFQMKHVCEKRVSLINNFWKIHMGSKKCPHCRWAQFFILSFYPTEAHSTHGRTLQSYMCTCFVWFRANRTPLRREHNSKLIVTQSLSKADQELDDGECRSWLFFFSFIMALNCDVDGNSKYSYSSNNWAAIALLLIHCLRVCLPSSHGQK